MLFLVSDCMVFFRFGLVYIGLLISNLNDISTFQHFNIHSYLPLVVPRLHIMSIY
jgi:hypothetical protein